MKRILLLILFVTGMSNAQIVNIPDPIFKQTLLEASPDNFIAKDLVGNYFKIDVNDDNEIQLSEAVSVSELNIGNLEITNSSGVEAFVNLTSLTFFFTDLASLDVSQLVNLKTLSCSGNQLTNLDLSQNLLLTQLFCSSNELVNINVSQNENLRWIALGLNNLSILDVTNCTYLQRLECDGNNLNSIDVTQNENLKALSLGNNSLTNLDVTQNELLEGLSITDNQITTIDVTQNLLLESLFVSNNQLTTLDVSQNSNLRILGCSFNSLSILDITQNNSLLQVDCDNNDLTNLNFSYNDNFRYLDCSENELTNLDFSLYPDIYNLICNNNLMTSIDVTQNPSLKALQFNFNFLSSVDVTQNPNLESISFNDNLLTHLDLSQNPNTYSIQGINNPLIDINIKNGSSLPVYLGVDSDLQFVCADPGQVDDIRSQVDSNTLVSSYCTFVPGGDFNTIAGEGVFDSNNNGCNTDDLINPYIRIDIDDGVNQGSTLVNSSGNYTFYTDAGIFDLMPNFENPSWFNATPSNATIGFVDNNNNSATQDFCIVPVGLHNDLEIVIVPLAPAMPGFVGIYQIVYKNKGNRTISGAFDFVYNDSVLELHSTSVVPSIHFPGSLSWNFDNLVPFESRSVVVVFIVNAPSQTPPINIDDILSYSSNITPLSGDENPDDNTFTLNQTVVGSYDPNDKTCLEGNTVEPDQIGEYLHFNINFENTGTAAATFVVVKDVIDESMFDLNTLQVMYASHEMVANITGNKVEFIFDNINLEPDGKGNVVFKIKTLETLNIGDSVTNDAEIFFDYNFPIETNETNTTFQTLSVDEFSLENTVSIYPNPTSSNITINTQTAIRSLAMYDVQGRLVIPESIGKDNTSVNMSNLSRGIYFLKIKTDIGEMMKKIIKE